MRVDPTNGCSELLQRGFLAVMTLTALIAIALSAAG